jgi:hypothetical protein
MRAAWLWSAADWRRGWRSVLAVAVLAGGVGGVVIAAVAGARRASTAVERMAARSGWPDIFVFTSADVPEPVREVLAADPRVAQPTVDVHVVLAGIDGYRPGVGNIVAVPPGSRFRPVVMAGRLPAAGAADEIAVPERVARDRSLEPGDRVPLVGIRVEDVDACLSGGPDCRPGPIGEATVTGVTRTLPDLVDGDQEGLSVYADAAFAEAHPTIGRSNIVMVYTHGRDDALTLTEQLSPLVTRGDVTDGRGDASGAAQATSIERNSLLIAGALVAVSGLVLLAPAYGRHLARRRQDPHLLSALGMPRHHRHRAGTLPGVFAGLLAIPVAVLVGVAGSLVLPLGAARRAELGRSLEVDGVAVGLGAGLTFTAVVLVAAAVAWRWSRTATEQAPRGVGTVPRVVAAMGLRPVVAAGARLALDPGSSDDRLPVVPTIAATAVGAALAVGALVVAASTTGLLGSPSRYGAAWDLEVRLRGEPAEAEAAASRLATDDRVAGAAILRTGELRVRSERADLGEIGAVGFRRLRGDVGPAVLTGAPLGALDDVLLATDSYERGGVQPGDKVTVEGGVASAVARVVGRTILPAVGATFSDIGVILPLEQYEALGAEGLVDTLDVSAVAVLVVPDDGDRAALEAELLADGFSVEHPGRPMKVTVLRGIGPVAVALAVATTVVVLTATTFALVTATRRRRGELAVLRALGLRPAEVSRAVGWQAVVVIGVALAAGIPLGVIGGRVVWRAIADANHTLPVVDVPLGRVALAVVVLLLVALGGALVPARRAAAVHPADVLRSE